MNICSFENFYMVNIRGNDVTNYSDLKWELLCEHQDKNSLSNQNYIFYTYSMSCCYFEFRPLHVRGY